MPNIKSAKKRVLTSAKKREVNNTVAAKTKTSIKKLEKSVKAGDKAVAKSSLDVAIKNVDKSLKSGLMHKNKAARVKSRLAKMQNNME